MQVRREQCHFAAVIGTEARNDMFDIMGECGLTEIECQIIDDLDFAIEDVEFIAAIDHKIIKRRAQRTGRAILYLILLEISQRALFAPIGEFGQAGLFLLEQFHDATEILHRDEDLGNFGNERRIGHVLPVAAEHLLRDQMPELAIVEIFGGADQHRTFRGQRLDAAIEIGAFALANFYVVHCTYSAATAIKASSLAGARKVPGLLPV